MLYYYILQPLHSISSIVWRNLHIFIASLTCVLNLLMKWLLASFSYSTENVKIDLTGAIQMFTNTGLYFNKNNFLLFCCCVLFFVQKLQTAVVNFVNCQAEQFLETTSSVLPICAFFCIGCIISTCLHCFTGVNHKVIIPSCISRYLD